jgi:fatty-acyl-CoA synthase
VGAVLSPGETLFGLLESSASSHGDRVALEMSFGGDPVTYAELLAMAGAAASGLQAAGFRRGDALAVWLPSGVEWVVLHFAAARLGLLMVPLNTRYRAAEVGHLLGTAQAKGLVFMPSFHGIDFSAMVAEVLGSGAAASVRTLVTVGQDPRPDLDGADLRVLPYADLLAGGAASPAEPGEAGDLVVVFGTSGTTSFPKLASHDQRTVARHVRNAAAALHVGQHDRMLCFLPFCGTFGFVALMVVLATGARAVVQPVYGHDEAVEAIERHGVTMLFAMEPVYRGLFAAAGAGPEAFRTWDRGVIAGMTARDLVDRAERQYGLALTNVYGSSELFAIAAVWDPAEPAETRALPGGRLVEHDMHVRAVDPAEGAVLPEGEPGELQFSGYNVTRGYLANEAANAQAFTADGWFRSGDRGRVLEGGRAFEYQARISDTLRLRGYLVAPAEIEDFLRTHGSVVEAQVVGVADPARGEDRAVAFVRARPGARLDPEEIRAYCRSQLAGWKVPDVVQQVEAYPTTPSANGDKVQKNRLRDMAADLLGLTDT